MNTLSQKSIKDLVSDEELKEFKELVSHWNESVHFNLYSSLSNLRYVKDGKYL
ncbi:MAG: hypothetical protein ACI9YH_002425 [Colwellia sp.]|jgi:hypothetical protein